MEIELRIVWQDLETGLFEIKEWGSNKILHTLTREELNILMELMPTTQWIVILWNPPPTKENLTLNQ